MRDDCKELRTLYELEDRRIVTGNDVYSGDSRNRLNGNLCSDRDDMNSGRMMVMGQSVQSAHHRRQSLME